MKIYIKSKDIKEFEVNKKWLEEKPEGISDYSWSCDYYIKTLGKGVRDQYFESSESEFNVQKLKEAREAKIAEIKAQRDENLKKPTPQTITYGGNLANRSFNINPKNHLPLFSTIKAVLQSKIDNGEVNPTRTWSDSNGEVLELTIADYTSLINHLDDRDATEYALCSKRIASLEGLTLEEVEAFDITKIYE